MRLDPYRIAYELAVTDLIDISGQYEQLRARKEHVEGIVAALGPILGVQSRAIPIDEKVFASMPRSIEQERNFSPEIPRVEATALPSPAEIPTVQAAEPTRDYVDPSTYADPSTYSFLQVPAPLPELEEVTESVDLFQRRGRSGYKSRASHRGMEQAV